MRHTSIIAMTGSAALTFAAVAVPPAQSFGTLAYPGIGGTEIPFTWSTGENDNSGFIFTNNQVNGSWLTIGLRASPYYSGVNGFPQYVGNSTYQVDAGTTAPDVGGGNPNFDPNGPRWGFNWSVSMDGSRSAASLSGLWWSMRIVGPNGTGNWGTTNLGMADLGAAGGNPYASSSWQLGYNFFPLSSANTPGVSTPGLWDGLNFNPNTLGDYQFTITARQGQFGAVVGSTTMTVSVVPAPGALALLGVAGVAGTRRRRA